MSATFKHFVDLSYAKCDFFNLFFIPSDLLSFKLNYYFRSWINLSFTNYYKPSTAPLANQDDLKP